MKKDTRLYPAKRTKPAFYRMQAKKTENKVPYGIRGNAKKNNGNAVLVVVGWMRLGEWVG